MVCPWLAVNHGLVWAKEGSFSHGTCSAAVVARAHCTIRLIISTDRSGQTQNSRPHKMRHTDESGPGSIPQKKTRSNLHENCQRFWWGCRDAKALHLSAQPARCARDKAAEPSGETSHSKPHLKKHSREYDLDTPCRDSKGSHLVVALGPLWSSGKIRSICVWIKLPGNWVHDTIGLANHSNKLAQRALLA